MPASKLEIVAIKNADALAFLGAAYLSTDACFVLVSRKGKDWRAVLTPKGAQKKIAALFRETYDGQVLRWSIARANRGMRADVLRRALELCRESGGKPAGRQGTLLPEQTAEIARLLAEAEADKTPKDPLGITHNWEDLREGKP